jgi:hypothetical protein
MIFSKKKLLILALSATASAYAIAGNLQPTAQSETVTVAQATPAPAPAAAAPNAAAIAAELDTIESFSDTVYQRRIAYFNTVKHNIAFKSDNFPADLKTAYSETLRDFEEKEPRRTNWMMPTDTGWISAGGADLYDLHVALMRTQRAEKNGKVLYGPVMITEAMMVDMKDHTKRVEAKFGNKILAFRNAENRDAYAKLVQEGRILEVQDMQCAMAPVHPKRPHLVGATRMIIVAEEVKGNDGKPVYVRTYNSAHVYASYDLAKCAPISNSAFRKFSEEGRTAAGAAILVKRKELDDQRIPAYTPINPLHNVECKPVS